MLLDLRQHGAALAGSPARLGEIPWASGGEFLVAGLIAAETR